MPFAADERVEREDPQVVIERLARHRISDADADRILASQLRKTEPQGLMEQIVAHVLGLFRHSER